MTIGGRFLVRHDGWGTATPSVRSIAQGEIPAYAGMTWVVAGMTGPDENDVGVVAGVMVGLGKA